MLTKMLCIFSNHLKYLNPYCFNFYYEGTNFGAHFIRAMKIYLSPTYVYIYLYLTGAPSQYFRGISIWNELI